MKTLIFKEVQDEEKILAIKSRRGKGIWIRTQKG
jgi:hypothetical protein